MKRIFKIMLICFFLMPMWVKALTKEEMQEVALSQVLSFDKLDGYQVFQGFTITEQYYILSLNMSDDSKACLLVIDKETNEIIKTIESTDYGHANDIAYDEVNDEILIINGNTIYVLDAESFEQKSSKTLDTAGNAIDLSEDSYFVLSGKTINIYDTDLKLQTSFSVETNLITQGIKYFDGYIYLTCYESGVVGTYEPYYDGILEAGANVVYIYDLNGVLINTFYIPSGYGEIEGVSFLDNKYYLLFNNPTSTEGIIYTLDTEEAILELNIPVTIDQPIVTTDDLKASVYDGETVINTTNVTDGEYTFLLTLVKDGSYSYTIKQDTTAQYISFDEDDIQILVNVTYDFLENVYETNVIYADDKNTFENTVDYSQLKCEVVLNKYYNEDGEEVTEEEFESTCKVVENPQTGYTLPITLFIGVGIISVLIFLYRRKLLYKL